jgi:hypothetical protein
MDTFILVIGLIGVFLLTMALVILINIIVNIIKGRTRVKRVIYGLLLFVIVAAFASSFIYFSLFLRTFVRYTHEEKIGWIYAASVNDSTSVTFYDEKENRMHFFRVTGDQWMIEGHFLRWSTVIRWLGAGPYYRITRFSGRSEKDEPKIVSIYRIHPEEELWQFLLKHAEKIPGVDTAYGIGAFQYASPDTFYVYINDTGFILRKH